MTKIDFTCQHCGAVASHEDDTGHNHCPGCLWSMHVGYGHGVYSNGTEVPAEVAEGCGGMMAPVKTWDHPVFGPTVMHRCEGCGQKQIGPRERVQLPCNFSVPSLGVSLTLDATGVPA